MKKTRLLIGRILAVLTWPLSYIVINGSQRTRLLIKSGNKILVVRPWINDGRWSLPGGGMHKNETPINGVIREVYEEVGIKFSPEQLKYIGKQDYDERRFKFVCHYFLVELPQEVYPKSTFEIADYAWFSNQELGKLKMALDVRTALKLVQN